MYLILNQSINQTINQSKNHSLTHSINQSISQSITLISINQSINQPITCSVPTLSWASSSKRTSFCSALRRIAISLSLILSSFRPHVFWLCIRALKYSFSSAITFSFWRSSWLADFFRYLKLAINRSFFI